MVGRPVEGKKKVNLTLSPEFMAAARKIDPNLSRFVEYAGWKEVKRAMRLGPKLGPNGGKMGKK